MSTVAIRQNSALAVESDQGWWTDKQIAGLRQIGVDKASDGDLLVFMHVCQRTGLDPFARQIYMLGRNVKEGDRWVTKQTIQTGIDGYRLVARRAADRHGEPLEYEDTLWCGKDGAWRDVWLSPAPPSAAKVTVLRGGRRFSAVALYEEFKQTTKQGNPTRMWADMAANQIAKCAEALALRKAFPHDLSGVYTDDEMGQADRPERVVQQPTSGADRMRTVLRAEQVPTDSLGTSPAQGDQAAGGEAAAGSGGEDADPPAAAGETGEQLDTRGPLARRMFGLLGQVGLTERDERLEYVSTVVGRIVSSSADMTVSDAQAVVAELESRVEDPFGGRVDA